MNNPLIHGPALWLAQATLLLACFWVVYATLKRHPRARVMLCRIVSIALLALPLLSLAPVPPILHLPAVRLPTSMSIMANAPLPTAIPTPEPHPILSADKKTSVEIKTTDAPVTVSTRLPAITPIETLITAWLLGTTLLLLRWLIALGMARRLTSAGHEAPAWAHEIRAEIATHLSLAAPVRLRVIDHAGSPLLLGPSPVILLPRHLLEEDAQDDFVPSLVHEMVHVRELDWWWSQWLQIVAALLWPTPLVWFLRRAHDSAAEIVCDSIAASLVGGTERYAGTLARQSLHALGRPRLAMVPMLRKSGIRQRIDLLLSDFALPAFSRRSLVMTSLLALLACGVLSGVRLAAAADAPPPAAAPTPAKTAAAPTPGSTTPASPSKEIEPYGGITWNDGLFQVIQKIKKIDGITYIHWLPREQGRPIIGVSSPALALDLIPATTPEELTAVFDKWLSEYAAAYRGTAASNPPLHDQIRVYKDASGNDQNYLTNEEGYRKSIGSELTAGPLTLAGHPFELKVDFQTYPGFAVKFPLETVKLPNAEGSVIPFAITRVRLTTQTFLSTEARNAILDKLATKYVITAHEMQTVRENQELDITADGPAVLLFNPGSSEPIDYSYQNRNDLEEAYTSLLTKLSEDAAKKQPDGIKGL